MSLSFGINDERWLGSSKLSSCVRRTAGSGCPHIVGSPQIVRSGFRALVLSLVIATAPSLLFAATIAGTVTNGTTSKPSAGDEVILIKLAAGMEEAGHTKTDSQGRFTFSFDDAGAPHLIRAIDQGVTYHQPAPPGTTTVDVQVYDASPKVEGVHAVADLMYLQASRGQLGVTRIFAVDNTSSPPRTQMNDANFEFYVPDGGDIDDAQAQTEGGKGVKISPTPQKQKEIGRASCRERV